MLDLAFEHEEEDGSIVGNIGELDLDGNPEISRRSFGEMESV